MTIKKYEIDEELQNRVNELKEAGTGYENDNSKYFARYTLESEKPELVLFYWKFVESLNTSYPHQAFAYAVSKERAIELITLQLDYSDAKQSRYSDFIVKSITNNEPMIIDVETGVLMLSKC